MTHNRIYRCPHCQEKLLNHKWYCNSCISIVCDKVFEFVEFPTADTGNKKDRIDEAAKSYMFSTNAPKICNTDEHIGLFRKSVEKFMPKPVEPVLIPVTSTIEEQVKWFMDWFKSDYDTIIHDYEPIEITLRQLLSSLSPIGKKRTRLEIWEYFWIQPKDTIDTIDEKTRDKMMWAYSFLKDNNALQG